MGYGDTSKAEVSQATHVAAAAWSFHYIKRLLETIFVHRFSNATMPLGNLFKNCSYYWGFAAYIAYHINHPLYTPPTSSQVYIFLAMFLLCELGNFTIHILLRNLRPAGSKVRDWSLDLLQHHDSVSSCWSLHLGRSLSDGNLGHGETQKLRERIQRLPKEEGDISISSVKYFISVSFVYNNSN